MAIFLFAFHNLNLLTTTTMSSKLLIEGHTDLIITNTVPDNIKLTLRGDGKTIADISENDIKTFIDLSPYKAKGSYRVPVKMIKSGGALNADTLEISVEPIDVMIQFDNTAEKNINVSPVISGSPAAGYDLASEKVTPEQLKVEGPASLISRINTIVTESFDISDRYEDFSVLLNVVSPGRLFTIHGGDTVEYSAVIRPAYIEKEFSPVTLTVLNLNKNFTAKITPETGSVTLRGQYSDIKNFNPEAVPLTVDCSDIDSPGTFNIPVNVSDIKPLEASVYTPETATITITNREE
jgi:YbbR domain-containing protein